MSLTENNGVHCAVETRRVEPADGVRDNASTTGTQPYITGGVGGAPGDGQAKRG